MSDDEPLFADFEPPDPPAKPDATLSADRRRTIQQAEAIKAGRHPLMPGPLHPEADRNAMRDDGKHLPFRCGSCVHRLPAEGSHSWPKCDLTTMSHCGASDVRAWWPACPKYAPTEDGA